MTPRDFVLVLSTGLALAGGSSRAVADDEKSWTGESVVFTKYPRDIKFGNRVEGKEVYIIFPGKIPLTVREDRDGWLRVHDGHAEGWADKDDFVLTAAAPAHFDRRVRADPTDDWALWMRAAAWRANGEYENAVADYDECIRRDPTNVTAFNFRGMANFARKEYDLAIADYGEAIRLDPTSAYHFNNRGTAWRSKKDHHRAMTDYDHAVRLDPTHALVSLNRSVEQLLVRDPGCVKSFQAVIDLRGYKGDKAVYAVVLGHLAADRAGDAATAKRFLADSAGKLDPSWPEPVVGFLRGDLGEPALLKLATDDDKKTEARCFLGLHHAFKGRPAEALAHLRWVKEHGNTVFLEHGIAVAELERLDAAAKP